MKSVGGGVTLTRNPRPTPTEAPLAEGLPSPPRLSRSGAVYRALVLELHCLIQIPVLGEVT